MAINIRTDKNNYRSSATCTYCGGDHTITGCQEILDDAETGKKKRFSQRTFKEHYAMQWVEKKAKTKKLHKLTDTKGKRFPKYQGSNPKYPRISKKMR